jgi:hypothetical protein
MSRHLQPEIKEYPRDCPIINTEASGYDKYAVSAAPGHCNAMSLRSNGVQSPPSPTPLRQLGVGAGEAPERASALPPGENDTNGDTAPQLRRKD